MGKRLAAFLVFILGLFLSGSSTLAQGEGSIGGIVVDEEGISVSGAKVNANPMNGRPMGTLIRYVETDREGHFLIDRLEWGSYGVFAMKEESGYPNMRALLYSNGNLYTATIAPSAPIADVRIQLGPKAGVIIGSITNVMNGAPLNAAFKLVRSASPDEWLSTSAPPDYRILVPSSTDVLLEVAAPGFRTWTPGHPLHLESGAEMRLDIQLEPSHDPGLHPSRFLVPDGFVGWLLLDYGVKGAELVPTEDGMKIFKFPASGALSTSSAGPERGAEDKYFYYFADGSLREIASDYRNGKGMIWGQHEGTRSGALSQFGFFIGTEEQYKKFKNRMTHPGPIPAP